MSDETPSRKIGKLSRGRLIDLLVIRFHEAEACWERERERQNALEGIRELLSAHAHEPFIGRLADHLDPGSISLEQLYTLLVPIEREQDGLNLRDEDFVPSSTREQSPSATMPVRVVLDNLRSAFNIGGVFRTCECMGVAEVVLTGYTATPEHAKVRKAALGAEESVAWQQLAPGVVWAEPGSRVIALEQGERSQSLYEVTFDFPCTLVLGNERFGLNPSVVDAADEVVHIPMQGRKQSLNVVSAFAMCAYEMRRQFDARV